MFVLLTNNRLIQDVSDVIYTPEVVIIVQGNQNTSYASNEILMCSQLYPSKDMLDCVVQHINVMGIKG